MTSRIHSEMSAADPRGTAFTTARNRVRESVTPRSRESALV